MASSSSDEQSEEAGGGLEGDDVHVVQMIVKKARFPDGTKYLIRWKGWAAAHDTWEPASNIAPELLTDFADEHDEEEGASEGEIAASSEEEDLAPKKKQRRV